MRSAGYKNALLALVVCLVLAPSGLAQHSRREKHDTQIWNYDGGVFFETDGSLPNGVCFRVTGRMSAGEFFEGLRRIDTDQGTTFRRGTEAVTQFPDSVTITFSIRDQLCPSGLLQVGGHVYMTQQMINDLRLSIYWKHGVNLRPMKNVVGIHSRVDKVNPYATALAAELPPRYEWTFDMNVPSAGVLLMDSLAFVFRTPDGRIAASVAARL